MSSTKKGKDLVLAIGINAYDGNYHPRLNNAVHDVERLVKVLCERYNFETVLDPVLDSYAMRDLILNRMDNLHQDIDGCNNLIIYFAGHGAIHDYSGIGYWVPIEGTKEKRTFISNSEIIDLIKGYRARHILLISDSCYSGTFITHHGVAAGISPKELSEEAVSRWVLTSGEQKKVSDGQIGEGSPFAKTLCELLEKNTATHLKASTMFNELMEASRTNTLQKAAAAELKETGSERGQMVLTLSDPIPRLKLESTFKPDLDQYLVKLPEHYISRYITFAEGQTLKSQSFFSTDIGLVYLSDIVKSQKRIALLGGAGSGKSIELAHLANTLYQEKSELVPIFRRFNTYTDQEIADYLPKDWNKVDPNCLVIFLDGLDEVQPQFFPTAIRKLEAFSQNNPSVTMVISCRANFYEIPKGSFPGTLEGFKVYSINDISIEQVHGYLLEHYQVDVDAFMEKVYDAKISDLVQKPFFLNVLVAYFKEYHHFSLGRGAIMESLLLNLYEKNRIQYKSSGVEVSKSTMFADLEKVAFIMELAGKNYLTDHELHSVFTADGDYSRCKFLPAFTFDQEHERWMFEHNNIQEYLASRVLAKQKFEKLTKILFVQTPVSISLRPSWINTLSFLISIDKGSEVSKLVDFILASDKEAIIRFETDRLEDHQRTMIVKHIFKFHGERNIWISSTKFTIADLMRFGRTKDVLQFLIAAIEDGKSSQSLRSSAVYGLLYFDFRDFEVEAAELWKILCHRILSDLDSFEDTHRMISLLVQLDIDDELQLIAIISKYKKHKSQYIRAGIYEVISNLKNEPERFLDIIMDGFVAAEMENGIGHRESFSLGDEDFHLNEAVINIKSINGLNELLKRIESSDTARQRFIHNHTDSFKAIIENAIFAFADDPSLYDPIFRLVLISSAEYEDISVSILSRFFTQTSTQGRALIDLSNLLPDHLFDFDNLIKVILTETSIIELIDFYKSNGVNMQMLLNLYSHIWGYRDSENSHLTIIEAQAKANLQIDLQQNRPAEIPDLWEKRNNDNFEVMFDKMLLLEKISRVFELSEKEELVMDDIKEITKMGIVHPSQYIPPFIFVVLRHCAKDGKNLHSQVIQEWVNSDAFINFQVRQIYNMIRSRPYMQLKRAYLDFLKTWATLFADEPEIVWYLLHQFKFPLPDQVLLNLTAYYNFNDDRHVEDEGSLEMLEKHLNNEILKSRVTDNLGNENIKGLAWLGNASYALRKNLSQTFQLILQRLQSAENIGYRELEILSFWFKVTRNITRLKIFVERAKNNDLKWKGIKILIAQSLEKNFVLPLLQSMMVKPDLPMSERVSAANELIKLGELSGFDFLYDELINTFDPIMDFRNGLNSFPYIRSRQVLEKIMNLLYLSKSTPHIDDIFNTLESRIHEALEGIAGDSDQNYIAVRSELEHFIVNNEGKLANVNYLHYLVVKLDENNKLSKITETSINTALVEYEKLE